jgi:hypothetical protein
MDNQWLSLVERQISPLAQEINLLPKVGRWP